MILSSPYPDVVIPDVSISEYLLQSLDKHGDAVALVDGGDNENFLTFKQVKEKSVRFASALTSLGVGKGDFIATCFSNCLEFPLILIGGSACGAAITTCNPLYKQEEIKKQFRNAEPKIVFIDAHDVEKMKEISKEIKSIQYIFTMQESSDCKSIHDLIREARLGGFPHDVRIDPSEDIFILPYSSGTTGLPKGVVVSHRSIVAILEVLRICLPFSKRDVAYMVLPMFHIFGMVVHFLTMIQGAKLIVEKRFSIEKFFEATQRHKITTLGAVPPMVLAMHNSPLLSKYDLSSLTSIICGAAPLPVGVATLAAKNLGARIYQAWGLTEGIFSSAAMDPHIPIQSVGTPLINSKLKVVDVNSGKILGANAKGEVCAKGPQLMKGYYKNPSATLNCIDNEGWFHTGDIGYYDEFGCLYIVDRIKELIKYKGFQVAPAELEELLLRHPKVADAAVIGIPDAQAGQVPKAFIVRKDGSCTIDEIHKFIEGKVSSYKYLRGGIEFRDSIPKSPTGKILRRELRDAEMRKSRL